MSKPKPFVYTDQQIDEAKEVMATARSVLNVDPNAWKQHAARAAERHRGKTPEQVVEWVITRVVDLRDAVKNLDDVLSEIVPLYLAVWQFGRDGFPHFSLSEDFFLAMGVTDFGDPTEEPLYMPFNAFTMSFPASPLLGDATRAFVYQVPSILPRNGDFNQGFEIQWRLYRATLMLKEPNCPVWCQWPIGMTRAAFLDERRLMQADTMLDTIQLAEPQVTEAVVSQTLPGTPLGASAEVAAILDTLTHDQRVRVLSKFEAFKNGKILEEDKDNVNLELSISDAELEAFKAEAAKEIQPVAQVKFSANKTGMFISDGLTPAQEEAQRLRLDEHQKPFTARLRLLIANVMTYVEAAGALPTTREKGSSAEPVTRLHATQHVYEVGRAIKLDPNTRQVLKIGGGHSGWKLMHKYMVRGHYRNQVHGAGRALRRRQFIQPFWKGPQNVIEALNRTYEVK